MSRFVHGREPLIDKGSEQEKRKGKSETICLLYTGKPRVSQPKSRRDAAVMLAVMRIENKRSAENMQA